MASLILVALLLPLSRHLAEAQGVLAPDGAGGSRRPLLRYETGAEGEVVELKEVEKIHKVEEKQKRSCDTELCKNGYLLGETGTNNCKDPALHSLITTVEPCKDAAMAAGGDIATAHDSAAGFTHFVLQGTVFPDEYPMGCYREANDGPFFFNPSGSPPTNPGKHGATPVCRRNRHMNGTANSNGGCPTDSTHVYTRVLDMFACEILAGCEGYCVNLNNIFEVGNQVTPEAVVDERPPWAKLYNEMPSGCFIRPADGCVYYNTPQAAEPTAPIGIPICNISHYVE